MEWENETREADPKQTWPEDLVSWPSLNLRGFLPSDARPIISDSEFLSLLTKKTFSVYLLPSSYQIIVADAADAVSVNFSGRCKFLQI